ncbi:MerR family transcriptional regulator [Rheinheimera texasensis]|uniref:MerR family transcriptional regulator n=1 Tax=Rheinheimera texasensis TaxID=306205 RepID=UPI0032B22846
MKISELAQTAHIPAKTIRYYESVGLIKPPQRETNGYRYYQLRDVETLIFIRRCRELNIPIEDIKQLVAVKQNPEASCATVDNIIVEQLARVRQLQQELALLEHTLSLLVTSCSSDTIQDCCILQSLQSSK